MDGYASTHGQTSAKTVRKSLFLTRYFDISYARAFGGSSGRKDRWVMQGRGENEDEEQGEQKGGRYTCRRAGRRSKRGRLWKGNIEMTNAEKYR